MFDLLDGLPVHALVVHAVVVLLPLAVAGAVAVSIVPRWRRAYAPLAALLATAGTALVPVATRSGLELAKRVGPPAGAHQQLGGQLLWYALVLTVLLWALVLADRSSRAVTRARENDVPVGVTRAGGTRFEAVGGARLGDDGGLPLGPTDHPFRGGVVAPGRGGSSGRRSRLVSVIAVLTLVAALATGLQVFRVGESGARSVWGGIVAVEAG